MPSDYVPPESMTPTQLEKRGRILDAQLRLLEDHDPADISVKAVSLESGVALATLYRFFVSKDHLLAATLLHWETPLVTASQRLGVDPSLSVEARVMRIVRQGSRAYQAKPHMLALLVAATTSHDAFAREIMTEMRLATAAALAAQTSDLAQADAHLLGEIVQGMWFDLLVAWYAGRRTLTDGLLTLEQAVGAVVRGFDSRRPAAVD